MDRLLHLIQKFISLENVIRSFSLLKMSDYDSKIPEIEIFLMPIIFEKVN